MALLVGIVVITIWIGLTVGWHGFWRTDQRLPADLPEPSKWPQVAVVIPARDEAETIEATVRSVTSQQYPGRLRVIVVNDSSTDETARLARETAAAAVTARPNPLIPLAGASGTLVDPPDC